MNLKYIDIHSHLNLQPLKDNQEEVISRMIEKNVGTITIGVDYETSKEAINIASKYDFIWAGIGFHPNDNSDEIFDFDKYLELAKNKKVVCIGECGLDYFRNNEDEVKDKQKEIFRKHIKIAILVKKPLMMHMRPSKGNMDAYEDALSILNEFKDEIGKSLFGNFHFFVGNIDIAKKILKLGFTMSFDGPITFSKDYDELIKFLPIESIMIETDSPYVAPSPYRGKTCEPWMVIEVAKKVAEIKELSFENVSNQLMINTKGFFDI
jgi:TatD DNase family protein